MSWRRIHNTIFSSYLTNEPNKLEPSLSSLVMITLVYYAYSWLYIYIYIYVMKMSSSFHIDFQETLRFDPTSFADTSDFIKQADNALSTV